MSKKVLVTGGAEVISTDKSKKLLGYRPKFSMKDGLKEAVRWLYNKGSFLDLITSVKNERTNKYFVEK